MIIMDEDILNSDMTNMLVSPTSSNLSNDESTNYNRAYSLESDDSILENNDSIINQDPTGYGKSKSYKDKLRENIRLICFIFIFLFIYAIILIVYFNQ